MNDKFDLAKAMQNGGGVKDGRGSVGRIIYTSSVGKFPIVALFKNKSGDEVPSSFQLSGQWGTVPDSEHDLLNLPERIKRDVWVNVYKDCISSVVHTSKEKADDCSGTDRIACVHVTIDCEEGEGLDSYGKVG